jgi:hypothetical protein
LRNEYQFLLPAFWSIERIICLLEYPEKTDRLEQRQAAGKILKRPFFPFGVMAPARIDPP